MSTAGCRLSGCARLAQLCKAGRNLGKPQSAPCGWRCGGFAGLSRRAHQRDARCKPFASLGASLSLSRAWQFARSTTQHPLLSNVGRRVGRARASWRRVSSGRWRAFLAGKEQDEHAAAAADGQKLGASRGRFGGAGTCTHKPKPKRGQGGLTSTTSAPQGNSWEQQQGQQPPEPLPSTCRSRATRRRARQTPRGMLASGRASRDP